MAYFGSGPGLDHCKNAGTGPGPGRSLMPGAGSSLRTLPCVAPCMGGHISINGGYDKSMQIIWKVNGCNFLKNKHGAHSTLSAINRKPVGEPLLEMGPRGRFPRYFGRISTLPRC